MDWLLALLLGSVIASATLPEPAAPLEPVVESVPTEVEPASSIRPCPVAPDQPLRRNLRRPFHDAVYLTTDNVVCKPVAGPPAATFRNLKEEENPDALADTP